MVRRHTANSSRKASGWMTCSIDLQFGQGHDSNVNVAVHLQPALLHL